MPLTPQQVAEKKFTSTRFKPGYDESEVDTFLDEVETELTRLYDEAADLRHQLEDARSTATAQPQPPAPVSEPVEPVEAAEPESAGSPPATASPQVTLLTTFHI